MADVPEFQLFLGGGAESLGTAGGDRYANLCLAESQ